MFKRLALLSGLTLALAAPAHAGKRNNQPQVDLGEWLALAQALQTAAATGNLSSADAGALVDQIWSTVNHTWLDTGPKGKGKGKKGRKGKKGTNAQGKRATAVSAPR